jgi:hypothetical protein
MELVDFRHQPLADRRKLRPLERTGRDHDLIGLVDAVGSMHDEALAIVLE